MRAVSDDRTATYGDGTTVRTIAYDDGTWAVTTVPPVGGDEANRQAITTKALAVLDLNATYLALSPPTTAQVVAQVRLLTREVNALIRLRVAGTALDTTSGT